MSLRSVLLTVFKPMYLLFWGLKAEGLENIPAEGSFIIAGNHLHFDDPILHAMAVRRGFKIMAKSELMKKPLAGRFLKALGAFPVVRGTADLGSLDYAVSVLKNGDGLLIFPEGTRSKTGELGSFKQGVAFISGKSGAPVVPAARIKRRRLLIFSGVTLKYGPAVYPADMQDAALSPAGRRELTDTLQREIGKLIDEGIQCRK